MITELNDSVCSDSMIWMSAPRDRAHDVAVNAIIADHLSTASVTDTNLIRCRSNLGSWQSKCFCPDGQGLLEQQRTDLTVEPVHQQEMLTRHYSFGRMASVSSVQLPR